MLNRLRAWWNRVGRGWKWLVGTVVTIILYILISSFIELIPKSKILSWFWRLVGRFANLLTTHWASLVLVVFGILVWILYRRVYRLKRHTAASSTNFQKDLTTLHGRVSHLESYVVGCFEDDFKKDLNTNWEYLGRWKPEPGGTLSVTQSEQGGITRVGRLWMDYSFEFTAVIVDRCIGWIVRAQDLFNYYMIQLDVTSVRPHLRFGDRWIKAPQSKYNQAIDSKEHHLSSIELNKPIEVRTEVRGWEIRVHVNNETIYRRQDFFSMRFISKESVLVPLQPGVSVVPPFTRGRVGFRVAGPEHGKFSRCRVRPL